MRDYYNLSINLRGGITSPGTLLKILQATQEAEIRDVRFGSRQQLRMTVFSEQMKGLEKQFKAQGLDYEVEDSKYPNIISSYCAEEVFVQRTWLSEGVYKDILDGFDYRPTLKINLSDNKQSFTPFFTGNLNFVASPTVNFWYLFVRYPKTNTIFRWNCLIYSNDIPQLSKKIETQLSAGHETTDKQLENQVIQSNDFITQPIEKDLSLPPFMLPYYEGFNAYGSNYWLGIYRRSESFSVQFLSELCQVCQQTKIGQICITPWKSLIIKGIESQDRPVWNVLLGKHNINVRHAANELNWQTEDDSDEGRALRQSLIQQFSQHDVRTFGLCFAIQTRPKSEVFGSVIIRKRPFLFGLFNLFDLYHTIDFNPNTRQLVLFERGLLRLHVGEQLRRLGRHYYRWIATQNLAHSKVETTAPKKEINDSGEWVHQCPNCFTVYSETFGDETKGIKAGTNFAALPNDYCCPVCETDKSVFKRLKMKLIGVE